jgi:hypothetical protein
MRSRTKLSIHATPKNAAARKMIKLAGLKAFLTGGLLFRDRGARLYSGFDLINTQAEANRVPHVHPIESRFTAM